jgi:hypothetical protein
MKTKTTNTYQQFPLIFFSLLLWTTHDYVVVPEFMSFFLAYPLRIEMCTLTSQNSIDLFSRMTLPICIFTSSYVCLSFLSNDRSKDDILFVILFFIECIPHIIFSNIYCPFNILMKNWKVLQSKESFL